MMTDMTENKGYLHPITQTIRQAVMIFNELGFEVAQGPELEEEFYNFDALNIPKDHPSRDMQDTFWLKHFSGEKCSPDHSLGMNDLGLKNGKLLRTHTSPVQIRYMEKNKPPIRIIAPGKVYRNEATDSTHEAQFHQIEGLYVDTDVSVADLKNVLLLFARKFFGEDAQIRFRPSFFSFVEPGFEVDVFFKGKWLEVAGAGMVHPNVFKSVGIDSKKYKGFAFGMGWDRWVMIKYGIDDIRSLYNGDLRLVNQF